MQQSNQIPSQLSLLLPKSSNIKIVDSITGQRSLLGNDERDIIETDTEKMYYGVQDNYKWGVLLKSHGDSRFIDDLDDEVDWAQVMQESDFCIKLDDILCDLSHRENYFNSGAAIIMMKAFNNCIQIVSIGDCGALIFKNKKLIYKSKFHTTENTDELERLKEELGDTCSIINSAKPLPKIRSSTTYQASQTTGTTGSTSPSTYTDWGGGSITLPAGTYYISFYGVLEVQNVSSSGTTTQGIFSCLIVADTSNNYIYGTSGNYVHLNNTYNVESMGNAFIYTVSSTTSYKLRFGYGQNSGSPTTSNIYLRGNIGINNTPITLTAIKLY
jgi:hypothetical protein